MSGWRDVDGGYISSGCYPTMIGLQRLLLDFVKKKNPVNKNQGWEPIQQEYKANENTSRHNLNIKQKQTINKNQVETLCKEDS
jgi:hypothetical protein